MPYCLLKVLPLRFTLVDHDHPLFDLLKRRRNIGVNVKPPLNSNRDASSSSGEQLRV